MRFKNYLITGAVMFVIVATFFYLVNTRSINNGKVAGDYEEYEPSTVHGIILPHHSLVSSVINKSYEKLGSKRYTHIVLIGPNHYHPEVASVVTSQNALEYSFDNTIFDELIKQFPNILINEDIVTEEHSIMLQMPFIEKYFPNASVVPLIISPYAGKTELYEELNFLLEKLPPEETLFIASVDFSHGLLRDEALVKNEESINVIKNFDYETLYSFTDDHMDSPLSVALLLKAMETRGVTRWETWESLHGSMVLDDPSLQGTSYVIGVFR